MSGHCNCCANKIEHIRHHYDPMGLMKPDEDPEKLLAMFRNCFGDDCTIDVEDIKQYQEEIKKDNRI